MESELAEAKKEIENWKLRVPEAFSLKQEIIWLQKRVHDAEMNEQEARHQVDQHRLIADQRLMVKQELIKGQRAVLERTYQQRGDDRQTAQLFAALDEQNYDRASRIANATGPYTSPEKVEAATAACSGETIYGCSPERASVAKAEVKVAPVTTSVDAEPTARIEELPV